jgi:ubiquinone/menaquinone biosynthesis C-methylase UbiE
MSDDARRLQDARSYDDAAEVYERVNVPRFFDAPARALVAAAALARGARILDVGSGTGAVARAARAAAGPDAFVVAVDPSRQMLLAARRGGVDPVVLGLLPNLPFARASFDVVLSAFVLTHVDDADAALSDMARVLRRGGSIGVSAWAAGEDAVTAAWSKTVGRFVEAEIMNRAAESILPGESRFSRPGALGDALQAAGFADVHRHDIEMEFKLTVEEYVESREVGASGRALQALLTPDDWRHFRAQVRETLASRFPDGVVYTRRVFIATGRLRVR